MGGFNIYKRRAERKQGSGALKKVRKIANARISAFVKNNDVFPMGSTDLLHRTETAPVGVGGYVSNTTTYAKCMDGYQGRAYAHGVALS